LPSSFVLPPTNRDNRFGWPDLRNSMADIGPISIAALRQAAPPLGSFDAEYGNSVTLAPAAR
jgi:hypothetical protein